MVSMEHFINDAPGHHEIINSVLKNTEKVGGIKGMHGKFQTFASKLSEHIFPTTTTQLFCTKSRTRDFGTKRYSLSYSSAITISWFSLTSLIMSLLQAQQHVITTTFLDMVVMTMCNRNCEFYIKSRRIHSLYQT